MGERANIAIAQHPGGEKRGHLYLYTHWDGYELPAILERALAKRWRWGDEQYLARVIFCEMVKGREHEETGYGITTYLGDNSYPILLVDAETQTVRVTNPRLQEGPEYSFEDYLALDIQDDGWSALGVDL